MSDYITTAQLKTTLNITNSTFSDADIAAAITAASRAIDQLCNRRFWADADANQVRYYTPDSWQLVTVDDIDTITSVKTDTSLDQTFATTLASTDYFLEPYNAQVTADKFPYTRLLINPLSAQYFPQFRKSVKVTAKFGWSVTPGPITDATTILATKLLRRPPQAPFGIVTAGVDNGGVRRILDQDADLNLLIAPYRRLTV